MSKAPATKIEREYMDAVAKMGCIVCRNNGDGWVPAAIHHIRAAAGAGQRSPHGLVIPLCGDHHQHGGPGVAIHASRQRFEMLYGSEMELLNQTVLEAHAEAIYG